MHAGMYASTMHLLKAMAQTKSAADGVKLIDAMKAMPTDDPLFGKGAVRKDGRVIHDMHLFEVKAPDKSTGPWDYYTHKRVVPAAEAFHHIFDGSLLVGFGCLGIKVFQRLNVFAEIARLFFGQVLEAFFEIEGREITGDLF